MSAPRTGRRAVLKALGGISVGVGGVFALGSCADAMAEAPYPMPTTPASVPVAQVPVGGGTILNNAPYVVTQPTAGQFKAFSKICTHQRCPVQEIQGRDIVCLCHGSEFSIVDGAVDRGPAQRPLPEFAATVENGEVHIRPTQPPASRSPTAHPSTPA